MNTDYKAIACHFYDELEALAVKKVKSKIVFIDENEEKTIEDFIIDFKTKNKEEFMILSSGIQIRLDKIVKINDLIPKDYC